MKTLTAKQRRLASPACKAGPYVHQPIGPEQQAQQLALRKVLRPDEGQAKLTIGPPNDQYEPEADHALAGLSVSPASDVLPDRSGPVPIQRTERQASEEDLQRQTEDEEEESLQAKLIQRQADDEEEQEPIQARLIQRQMTDTVRIRPTNLGYCGPELQSERAEIRHILRSTGAQTKLAIGPPNDKYEQEADRVADQVMAMPDPRLQRQSENEEEEETLQPKPLIDQITPLVQRQEDSPEEEEIQAKSRTSKAPAFARGLESQINRLEHSGQPLSKSDRSFFEPRFGADFSQVRTHTDAWSARLARSVNAHAFTLGRSIVFGVGQHSSGRRLLAHELTHVVQQGNRSDIKKSLARQLKPTTQERRTVQRRLNVTGSQADVDQYLALLETVSGYNLEWTHPGPMVTINGNTGFGTQSQLARTKLRQIIDDRSQHANLQIGTHQSRVSVGARPAGGGGGTQRIDIDDITNLNTALPGQGSAKAFHEMVENYELNVAGGTTFAQAHGVGIEIESDVLEAVAVVGRRLPWGAPEQVIAAPAGQPIGPGITYHRKFQNFTTYVLEIDVRRTRNPAGGHDTEIIDARRVIKTQVSRNVVGGFASGSNAIPAAGTPTLNAIHAELNANANRSLRIESFTDSSGSTSTNLRVSRQRGEAVKAWFTTRGISARRIAVVGKGETNFVASNATSGGRATNRRVILTVHGPR